MTFKSKTKQQVDIDLSSRYDFDNRKCLHIKMYTETKRELHIASFRLGMTITKMFERLAKAVIEEDPYIIKMLNQYRIDLDNKEPVEFTRTDAESLFKAIEEAEKNESNTKKNI